MRQYEVLVGDNFVRADKFLGVTIWETSLIDIEGAGTENTCVRGANAGDTSSARSFYVKGAFVGGACTESTCIGGDNTDKHLRIDLQSLGILEVKLFGTLLEIGVEAY